MYIGLSPHTPFPKLFQPAKLPQFETQGGKEKKKCLLFILYSQLFIYIYDREIDCRVSLKLDPPNEDSYA